MRLSSWLTAFTNPITGFIPGLRQARTRRKPVGTKLENLEDRTLLTGTVAFSSSVFTIGEGAGASNVVELTRTGDTTLAGSVDVTFTDISATGGGTDYTSTTVTVNFGANQLTAFVPITISDDRLLEGSETFTATVIQNGDSGTSVGGQTATTVTITDNESATLSIATTSGVTEAGGSQSVGVVTLTITGTGTGTIALGTGISVSADVTQAGGSASSGDDYSSFGTQTVTFNGGAATGATQNATLDVLEDVLLEGSETVGLALGNLGAGGTATTLGNTTNTTTISDNESATLSIATSSGVTEAGGAQSVGVVTLTITGTGTGTFVLGAGISLTADVTQSGGSATSGSDYSSFGTQTVTFSGGAATGATQNATLNVLEDVLLEGSESVGLTLGNLGANSTSTTLDNTANTTTISDNESATLAIATTSGVTEAGGAQTVGVVTLIITGTGTGTFALGTGITLTADVTQAGGSATSGSDYTSFGTQTVTFNSGATTGATRNTTLTVTEDVLLEGSETVGLTLGNLGTNSTSTTLGNTANTTTISDNESATLSIATTSGVTEAGGAQTVGVVTLTITGTGTGTFALGAGISLTADVTQTSGTAISGDDYSSFGTQTVTFNGGATTGATRNTTLTVTEDVLLEGSETVGLTLGNLGTNSTSTTLGNTTNTTTISDNESATLAIATTSGVTEAGGAQTVGVVTLAITGTGTGTFALGAGISLTADVTQTGGTAASGSDYTAFGTQTVTFSGGATTGATQNTTLTVTEDVLLEGSETVGLTLGNLGTNSTSTTLGNTANTTTISDNESATLAIATTSGVTEAGGAQSVGVVTLTITGTGTGTFALGSGISLTANVTQSGGTATSGSDYASFGTQVITFNGGATTGATRNATLTVTEDVLLEGSETVDLTLGTLGAAGTATTLGNTANTTTISDNESATLSIATTSGVTEAGGAQTVGVVTLTITGTGTGTFALGSGIVLTADVTQAGGTAISGTDYTSFGTQTVTFNGGATTGATRNTTLTVTEDVLLEGSETVGLTLGNLGTNSTSTTLGNTANTTTIADNESATLSIATTSGVTEAGGAQTVGVVTLTITGTGTGTFALGTGISLTADVTQTGGTAASGSDYTAFGTQTVTFSGGATTGATQNTTLTVTEDVLLEGSETVGLTLGNLGTNSTSTTLGITANTTTISDNESATLAIATTSGVTEAGGAQTVGVVTLTITGTGTGTFALGAGISLTANVTQTGGTATSGSDYSAFGTQVITFNGGATTGATQNATLTVTDDHLLEASETVALTLGTLNAAGTSTTLGNTANSTTISDNESATLAIATTNTAGEGGGAQSVGVVTLTITGTGSGTYALGAGITLTADVTDAGGGTATGAGTDYAAIGTQTVTFSGGALSGATQNASLTPSNDTLVEGSETINLALGNIGVPGTVSASLGNTANVTTITDNDTAIITFTSAGNSVSEGGTATSFTVTLTITANGVANTGTLDRAVSFDVTDTVTGTATSGGVDYTFATQNYSFPIGTASNSSKIVNVGISEDLKNEGNETAVLQFSNLSDGSGGQVTTSGLHTVTINDNDTATTVVFNAPTGNGTDAFRIVLNGANLEFYDNGVLIDSRAMASITTLTIQGADNENDTLNVDLTGGDIVPSGGIFFNGGNGTGLDALTITGGSQGTVTYNYTNAHDGSVVMSAFGTVNYVGLEPITNTGTASDIIFNLPGTADATISLSDLVAGTSARLQSTVPTFELTDFAIPVAGGSITINLGDNNQTFTLSSLTLNANTDLIVDGGNGTDTIHLNAAGLSITDALTLTAETIDQANAVIVAGLTTLNAGAAGTISLALAGNNFNTLAITSANTASIKDDGGFVVAGATATTSITLESAGGTVTQTAAITAPTLTLQGAAGAFNLGTQNNAVTTLDADNSALASLNFKDDTGYAVAGINSTGAVTLESVGGTVTQTALIAATTLTLQGTGGTFNLGSQNNAVTTLDANTSALAALAFKDDTGYDVAGATASGAITLESAGGTVTQSAVISGTTLTLQGAAGTFNLGSQNNAITTLDANNATLAALTFKDDTGYSVAGATASGAITLESAGGTVTQSAAISGTTLTLQGAGGTFTLGTQNNAVTTLDADNTTLAALTFKDDTGYDVAGATATGAITLDSAGGTVTQSGVISGTTLTLQGTGGTFSLGSQNNAVTTLDANNLTLAALTFKDDTGYVVAGATASGAITLESAGGTVTQTAVISGTTLTLQGAGGTFTLNSQNNAVTTLDANNTSLAALSFKDDTGYDVAGATATGTVTLESVGGTVTESAAITGTTLTLQGANGTFSLGSQNN
ncbi:MAG: Calx-beta domain-containing protein, partial [Planctomycetota bacterium]